MGDAISPNTLLWAIPLIKIVMIGICGYFSALFSGSEVAILSLNRIRLLELQENGDRSAATLLKILERPAQLISSLLVANTTVNVIMVVLWTNLLTTIIGLYNLRGVELFRINEAAFTASAAVLFVGGALLTLLIILFCEILPKNLFHRSPEQRVLSRAGFLRATIMISAPLVWLTENISRALLWIVGIRLSGAAPPITEEELLTLVESGEEGGVIRKKEREMIHSILEFGDLRVRDVMVPRVDMQALRRDCSVTEAMKRFVETGFSRLPVYGKNRDDIVGILLAKDMLGSLDQQDLEQRSIEPLVQEVEYVPEEMSLSVLFKEMKQKKVHIAIIADEYGGCAGLVTIEDVLEEIVGGIRDEFDKEAPLFLERDGAWVVNGKLNLHDLERMLDIELLEYDADTVGGLIFDKLERIPNAGESVELPHLIFTVKRVINQRIVEVEIRKTSTEGGAKPAAADSSPEHAS